MRNDQEVERDFVDLLTIIMFAPCIYFCGWWGIPLAMFIGWCINMIARKSK